METENEIAPKRAPKKEAPEPWEHAYSGIFTFIWISCFWWLSFFSWGALIHFKLFPLHLFPELDLWYLCLSILSGFVLSFLMKPIRIKLNQKGLYVCTFFFLVCPFFLYAWGLPSSWK
jgi:hypothetical protein